MSFAKVCQAASMYALAAGLGLGTALLDGAALWKDDTEKVTVVLLIGQGILLGFLHAAKPWRWAVVAGLMLPIHYSIIKVFRLPTSLNPDLWSTVALLVPVALALCLTGAYIGMFVRRGIGS